SSPSKEEKKMDKLTTSDYVKPFLRALIVAIIVIATSIVLKQLIGDRENGNKSKERNNNSSIDTVCINNNYSIKTTDGNNDSLSASKIYEKVIQDLLDREREYLPQPYNKRIQSQLESEFEGLYSIKNLSSIQNSLLKRGKIELETKRELKSNITLVPIHLKDTIVH
ncbi:MAG TPA: hypothetical protein VG603_04645, partial [Chitinophagales bacterium]|nr:hypothetical protein [Chitinophagales bacterium]